MVEGELRGGSQGLDDVAETERTGRRAGQERSRNKIGAAAHADDVVAGLIGISKRRREGSSCSPCRVCAQNCIRPILRRRQRASPCSRWHNLVFGSGRARDGVIGGRGSSWREVGVVVFQDDHVSKERMKHGPFTYIHYNWDWEGCSCPESMTIYSLLQRY